MGTSFRPLVQFSMAMGIVLAAPLSVSSQDLQVEKVWEIGAVDGPPETIWERIQDAAILNGAVYAADIAMAEVREYSLKGEYLGRIGGKGQGPGEFVGPVSIQSSQDTLWIYDGLLKRWVIVNSSGEHVRTQLPEVPPRSNFFQRIWRGRHGWWVGETALIGRRRPSECDSTHFTIVWKAFHQTDTVSSVPGNPYWIDSASEDSLVMHTTENLGPSGGTWVIGDSLLVLVDGIQSEVSLYLLASGGLEKIRERPLPGARKALTAADREAAAEAYFRKYDLDPGHTSIRRFVLPDYWSAWTRVRGDDEGGLWLRRGGPELVDPSLGEHWVRWDLADDSFRELQIPPGVEILQFGERHAVGLRRDDWGVEYLLLYEIFKD